MAEIDNQQVKSKKDTALDRLRSKYPDKSFDDDEAVFSQINDDYDEYDRQIGDYQDRERQLGDMFASDPRSAHFLASWRNGEDPAVGLIRLFGMDIKDAIDDPEMQDKIAEANKEFVDRVAKEKELEEEYKNNLRASLEELDAFQADNGLTDDQVDNVMEFLAGIVRDGILGKFSRETMDMGLKAINHDTDVSNAEEEGEVRGKNTKITEKLRKRGEGDGTPNLDGKNGGSPASRPVPSLGALDNYDEGYDTIWERGGEKRKKAVLD